MTQEEALDIIRFVFLHTDNHLNDDRQISAEDIHEALVMACAALCKNSLPSNLDEAAIQAGQIDMCDRQIMEDSNEHRMLYSRIFRRGFKSGAEWMKSKMLEETIEGRISQFGFHNEIFIKEPEWTDKIDKFNSGDRVRILIINSGAVQDDYDEEDK